MGSGLNFIGPAVLLSNWEKVQLERWLLFSICHCSAGLVLLCYSWYLRLKQDPRKRRGLPASRGSLSSVSGVPGAWPCHWVLKTSEDGGPTTSLGSVPGLCCSHQDEPRLCVQPVSLVTALAGSLQPPWAVQGGFQSPPAPGWATLLSQPLLPSLSHPSGPSLGSSFSVQNGMPRCTESPALCKQEQKDYL